MFPLFHTFLYFVGTPLFGLVALAAEDGGGNGFARARTGAKVYQLLLAVAGERAAGERGGLEVVYGRLHPRPELAHRQVHNV